ncbi:MULTISPECIES: ABC transporter ATP-binding protein [Curtobacterium]|uniref:ABC transporter ATP-binding protein n=2 Tax=Curtobacterium TaxID=2034 RepID=UPI001BCD0DB2|nr:MULTISPECIES: ABC transporter ATP-binding protein [Curtobacterium]
MTDAAVTVDHVSKRFRMYSERNDSLKSMVMRGKKSVHEDFWALKDVSFEVPQGKTFGLIGKNGSGKSTLLKCLAKILWPEEGSITARGKQASLLEVGSGFHPELSGRENVFLNGSILGMSRKEVTRKFDDIVSFSGVGHFIDQPVKNYSSGMYVRLGFSVAVAVTPDVLVVDEVLAVGDATFQKRCRTKFKEMKDEGRTVILVSHSMSTVKDMCDEVAWLNEGELKMIGKTNDVVKAYNETV